MTQLTTIDETNYEMMASMMGVNKQKAKVPHYRVCASGIRA